MLAAKLTDRSESDKITSDISQRKVLVKHEPDRCPFESCEWYVKRFYTILYREEYVDVTWPKHGPEDDVVKEIHQLETKLKGLGCCSGDERFGVWQRLDEEIDSKYDLLETMLEMRLEKSGKICASVGVVERLMIVGVELEKSACEKLCAEQKQWEEVHGGRLVCGLSFVVRSLMAG